MPKEKCCEKHGESRWVESTPPGHGYCHQCAIDNYRGEKLGDLTGEPINNGDYSSQYYGE